MSGVQITVPSIVDDLITAYDVSQVITGQVQHEAIYSGRTLVVDSGAGRWAVLMRLGATATESEARAVEAWLAALSGAKNWSSVPFRRGAIGGSTTVSSVASGTVTVASAAALSSIEVGRYLAIDSRIHIITAYAGSGNTISIWPDSVADAGDAVAAASNIRARLAGVPPASAYTAHGYGPWVVQLVERR